ncbi:ATP-dependent RNA helicase DDX51 [Engystomops pustulosus]|uniref:ATP-dependent RNA helicase DDX51 n=1 Tax=Engystomops pustulosus TaxID=76066 RepID=UPI003AFB6555
MSLFVINRYLGDEVESTEDRAKALLEKLRQQAKERQSQLKHNERNVKEVSESYVEEEVTETIETTDYNENKKSKKRKKTLDETPTELESHELDAEPEEENELKAKKPHKKKIKKDKQEDESIVLEDHIVKKGHKKKVKKQKTEVCASSESTQSEDAKADHKKKHKKHKHKQVEENSDKGSGDSGEDPVESTQSEDAKADHKKKHKKHKHKQVEENSDKGSGDSGEDPVEANNNDDNSDHEFVDSSEDPVEAQNNIDENSDQELVDAGEDPAETHTDNDDKKEIEDAKMEQNGKGKKNALSNPKSLLLGGFEAKPVQKVLPFLPLWLAKPSLVQKDIKQNLVSIHDVPGIDPNIKKRLEANNVKSFFPVQAEVMPAILDSCVHGFLVGRGGYLPNDICVSAPTGSGKTLAFVLPIIQVLMTRVVCEVRALVLLPTKELAQQVCKVFNVYADGTGLKVCLIAGHKPFAKEQESLVQKKIFGFCSLADILVCTPGRLVDHIQKTEGFTLRHLRFLVIDEADRMIDTMSQDWLPQVINAAYKPSENGLLFDRKLPTIRTAANYGQLQMPLQKLLFSATLTHNPEKLQKLDLYQPRLFTSIYKQPRSNANDSQSEPATSENFSLPKGLTHYYIPCVLNSKPLILLHFLLTLRFSRVLCFTNSRESSHRLFLLIKLFGGIDVAEFSSRLSPGERKKTLKEFEQGKIKLLISTDATARGIDITGVKCVINYDAPQYMRVYVHRVGRTARGGTTGLAFTLLLRIQEQRYLNMMREAGVPKLQRQPVKNESLRQFEQRYEEVLSQLQKVVKEEYLQKRC